MTSGERKEITRREFLEYGWKATAFTLFFPQILADEILPAFTERVRAPEKNAEQILKQAYRTCFRTYEIAGRPLTLRIPFAWVRERFPEQIVYRWGKGNIEELWQETEKWLSLPAFYSYLQALQEPEDKVIHFNLPKQKFFIIKTGKIVENMKTLYQLFQEYSQTGNTKLVNKMTQLYPGNDSQVYIFKEGASVTEFDMYNFFYCIPRLGIDCARLVYYGHQAIYGKELDIRLGKALGVSPLSVPYYIGSWFYNPYHCRLVEKIEDKIINLQPGDVIHFQGRTSSHSVIIQSVNLENRVIRYFQCTDWALPEERGVHESYILFDNPHQHLSDKTVEWTQKLLPTFPGESKPAIWGWRTDGDRYRTAVSSMVVRLKSSLTSGIQ